MVKMMVTNREYLNALADIGDGSLTDWFDQEHVEIVRCRDCKHYNTKLTDEYDGTSWCCINAGYAFPDDGRTEGRMTELIPCPFCGSGWLYETRRNGYCDDTPVMFCNSCKAVVTWEQVEEEGVNDETKAFVREHWNTRAEQTCRDVSLDSSVQFYCSECECTVDVPLLWGEVNYCPNCGAKVVGE